MAVASMTRDPAFLTPDGPLATPPAGIVRFADAPFPLEGGGVLASVQVAYTTYGTLNADRSNAILICHALTGDQFVGSANPVTGKDGWWTRMVGPGLPIDTERFFVVCPNVLGGCMGTTGPSSLAPNGQPYAMHFPLITVGDMVRAQQLLMAHLGLPDWFMVIGGSMGGMLALQWASSFPEHVFACAALATAAAQSAQNIAFYEVGRQAIMADPDWHDGAYALAGVVPAKGLAVARMAAHITYLSETALHRKFGRHLQNRDSVSFGFDADFRVESYLRYQGRSFVDRFDANSYLYITRAMDYFDLAAAHDGHLARAFVGARTRFCVFAFSSDWHYPPSDSKTIVRAMSAAGADVSYVEVDTDKGHDAFLLDEPEFENTFRGFIAASADARGLARIGL